jgi:hypothetical protein
MIPKQCLTSCRTPLARAGAALGCGLHGRHSSIALWVHCRGLALWLLLLPRGCCSSSRICRLLLLLLLLPVALAACTRAVKCTSSMPSVRIIKGATGQLHDIVVHA